MKSIFILLCTSFFVSTLWGQVSESKATLPDSTKKILLAEAACGKCMLGLPGKGCDLAVRINGKAMYIDGAEIDSYGDAHAQDGFCNAIRKAEVQGEVVNDRFKLTYLKLIKERKKNDPKTDGEK